MMDDESDAAQQPRSPAMNTSNLNLARSTSSKLAKILGNEYHEQQSMHSSGRDQRACLISSCYLFI
jgi:hypothetical protein